MHNSPPSDPSKHHRSTSRPIFHSGINPNTARSSSRAFRHPTAISDSGSNRTNTIHEWSRHRRHHVSCPTLHCHNIHPTNLIHLPTYHPHRIYAQHALPRFFPTPLPNKRTSTHPVPPAVPWDIYSEMPIGSLCRPPSYPCVASRSHSSWQRVSFRREMSVTFFLPCIPRLFSFVPMPICQGTIMPHRLNAVRVVIHCCM
mmetsp:Transcript_19273/g.34837  ORF Transcript_19273/g.34837 Transcript_19273/m.34837 type:complete len:200 (+) Transcript_19273:152-751(+)